MSGDTENTPVLSALHPIRASIHAPAAMMLLSFGRINSFNWTLITFQLDGKRSTIGRHE